ncbi:MAG: carboxylating nicotinate-nucleotide diphosphorylase [Calditrichia bacterium]
MLTDQEIIQYALNEDIGTGDITSEATIAPDIQGKATIFSKDEGVLAGCDLAQQVFLTVDSNITINKQKNDGDQLYRGEPVLIIDGPVQSLLKAERVALNILGHLSGIATRTNSVVKLLSDTSITLLDTRKTMPLFRRWQKYAVRVGGGKNHRIGLYDMFLIKENHIAGAGNISAAITNAIAYREKHGEKWQIEIETKNENEVREAVQFPIDIIMLDNMDKDTLRKCIDIIRKTSIKIEVSGNMNEHTINQYKDLDIDYISMGSLTHSVKNFDFSMLLEGV